MNYDHRFLEFMHDYHLTNKLNKITESLQHKGLVLFERHDRTNLDAYVHYPSST